MEFIGICLLLERCMFRWIQVISEESDQYEGQEEEKFIPGSAYRYKVCNPNDYSNDVVDMLEYHVDTLPQLQVVLEKSGKKGTFGGWLSIRVKLGERPVIYLGQDKAILKQYIFTNKLWTYKGKCRLVPKYKGYGIMISAFQSREFGSWYPLTVPDPETVNEYHTLHPKYVYTDTSTTILRHDYKEPITSGRNPFCQDFEYSASSKVYWTYDQMVLQLEDYI